MASNITLWVTNNVTGQLESNYNFITVTPDSPNTDYILIKFTEKQNCNNVITALFQNVTTNCDISEINIVSADTSDLVNGVIHWDKLGRYDAKVYYQSSDTNLDTSLATFAYNTCLDVSSNTSCLSGNFSCDELEECDNFNAKLDTVAVDGVTITGDGTPENPLEAVTGGSGDMTKAVYDPQNIDSDAFDRANHTGTQAISTVTGLQTSLDSKLESGDNISELANDAGYLTDAPNDANTYARESGAWTAFTKFLNNVSNAVTGTFGFNNGDYNFSLFSGQSLWGRTSGANTGYFEALFVGGLQRMKWWSSDNITPETGADYSQTLTPSAYNKNFISVGYVQPAKLTISTATDSLTSSNINNQFINYTGSGGNITIESSYLYVDQEACISQGGVDQFTLVAGTGVTLQSPDGLLTSRVQFSSVGIYKINSTTYRITGDLS